MCKARLVGFRNQFQKDGTCNDGFVGKFDAGLDREEVPAVLPCYHLTNGRGQILMVQIEDEKTFTDDLIGQPLNPVLVRAARKKELEFVDGRDVCEVRPIAECRRLTGKRPVLDWREKRR